MGAFENSSQGGSESDTLDDISGLDTVKNLQISSEKKKKKNNTKQNPISLQIMVLSVHTYSCQIKKKKVDLCVLIWNGVIRVLKKE